MEAIIKSFSSHIWAEIDTLFSVQRTIRLIVEVAGDNEDNEARLTCGHQNKKASEYFEFIPANFNGLSTAFYIKTFCCKAVEVS